MFQCSISGEPTVHPVLSLKSHKIFDQNLLTTYVSQNSLDPITNEPMTLDDIVSIDTNPSSIANVSLKNSGETGQFSIPSMLSIFQNEWDSMALEIFELRKQLDSVKKELSMSLYRQDAAVKVAAKAVRERDEARAALTELTGKLGEDQVDVQDIESAPHAGESEQRGNVESENIETMNDDNSKINDLLSSEHERLFNIHKQENKERKGKVVISNSEVRLFKLEAVGEISGGAKSTVKLVKLNSARDKLIVIYSDGIGEIYQLVNEGFEKLQSFKNSPRSKFFVNWLTDNGGYEIPILATKGEGRIVNLLNNELIIQVNKNEIQGIIVHPSLPLIILLGLYHYSIIFNSEVFYKSEKFSNKLNIGAIHADGVLLAFSFADPKINSIEIHDIVQKKLMLTISAPDFVDLSDSVEKLIFASNGYSLIVEYTQHIGIFDLRKGQFQAVTEKKLKHNGCAFVDPSSSLIFDGLYYMKYEKKSKSWTEFSEMESTIEPVDDLQTVGELDGGYRVVVSSSNHVFIGQIR